MGSSLSVQVTIRGNDYSVNVIIQHQVIGGNIGPAVEEEATHVVVAVPRGALESGMSILTSSRKNRFITTGK